jgi:hypothetical protein
MQKGWGVCVCVCVCVYVSSNSRKIHLRFVIPKYLAWVFMFLALQYVFVQRATYVYINKNNPLLDFYACAKHTVGQVMAVFLAAHRIQINR